ncbi:Ku protein [Desulforamulus profundi]|nr:Ku protein [Desulforamulus profundi]
MRPLWKGAVSFGLVYVPVKMYAATEKKNIKFNYLHEKCKTPIQYRRYCPYCDTEVANEKILQDGKPSFSALQTRGKISDALKVKRLSRQIPATFIAFDVLYKAGENVMGMTTREKKQLLEEIVERGPDLIISQYVVGSGVDFYRAVTAAGLEGMVLSAWTALVCRAKDPLHGKGPAGAVRGVGYLRLGKGGGQEKPGRPHPGRVSGRKVDLMSLALHK